MLIRLEHKLGRMYVCPQTCLNKKLHLLYCSIFKYVLALGVWFLINLADWMHCWLALEYSFCSYLPTCLALILTR